MKANGWRELGKELYDFFSGYDITDAHVHVGLDVDGHYQSAQDVLRYTNYGFSRFVIFPFNEKKKDSTMPYYGNENRRIAEEMKKDSRLIGFGRIFPGNFKRMSDWKREIEFLHDSYGLKGVKLRPGAGGDDYYMSDIEPVLRALDSLDLPVIVHTDDRDRKANPLELVKLAKRHPNCNIIVAHMAKTRTDAIELAAKYKLKNIFWDLSVSLELSTIPFARALKLFGPEKIIFGSDSPYRDPRVTLFKFFLEAQKRELSKNDIQQILSRNMENLLPK